MSKYILILAILTPTVHLNENTALLNKSIESLNKLLDFVLDNLEDMDVDGLLGTNLALANLQKVISQTTDTSVRIKLKSLIYKLQKIWDIQGPKVPEAGKYHVFKHNVIPPEFWLRDIKFTHGKLKKISKVNAGPYDVTKPDDFYRYEYNDCFNETKSDLCLMEVSAASNSTEPHHCPVSEGCVEYLMKIPRNYTGHFPGYGVTHMLLFLQIALNSGCIANRNLIDYLTITQCSYINWELETNVKFGYLSDLDDLLFEQIALCGHEGFTEFLRRPYLERIIKVQDPHGCYGSYSNRGKRETRGMKYGCDTHTTGLAANSLGLFIRYMIENASNFM